MLAPEQRRVLRAAQPRQQQLQQPAPLGAVLLPARQQQLAQQRNLLQCEQGNQSVTRGASRSRVLLRACLHCRASACATEPAPKHWPCSANP